MVDGRGLQLQGYERRLLHRRHACSTTSTPEHDDLQGGDIRPGAVRGAGAGLCDAALELINAHEFGNGAASSPATATPRATSRTRSQVGMVGINVPIPVPMAFHCFGGWKRSLFGDHHARREGVRFYTRSRPSPRAGRRHPHGRRVRDADDEVDARGSAAEVPQVERIAPCAEFDPAIGPDAIPWTSSISGESRGR